MSKSLGYIDLAAVKAAVTLEQILEHYGILTQLKLAGAGLRGSCPIHKGNDPTQFSVNLDKGIWNCFSECQHGGNNLEFVMRMENCSLIEAAWKLNGWFNLGHEKEAPTRAHSSEGRKLPAKSKPATTAEPKTAPNVSAPKATVEPEEETGVNEPLGFSLQNLDGAHPYLTERGLSPETIAEFGIGYCPKGILAGRIAIPIHNSAGALVANAGRWPGEPPEGKEKYRLPGKFKKSLELFNLHRAAAEPSDLPLVIVEGFFSVMHLWQHGIRRVVAIMGSSLSNRQEELIANLVTSETRIVLMLDNDDAGISARKQIIPRLAEHCFVRNFRFPEGCHQPDSLTVEHLAELRA